MVRPVCTNCGSKIPVVYWSSLIIYKARVADDGRVDLESSERYMARGNDDQMFWYECRCGAFLTIYLNDQDKIEEIVEQKI